MKNAFTAALLTVGLIVPVGIAAQGGQGAQQSGQKPHDQRAVGTTGAASTATVNDVVDNPSRYFGEKVSVSGEVGEVFGQQLFRIEEKGLVDVDDSLLVLLPKKHKQNITDDSVVQVRGTVREFVRGDIERDYGIDDWDTWGIDDDNFFTTWDRKPVLIADAIDIRR